MAVLRLKSKIILTQVPSKDFPSRNNFYTFTFVHEVNIVSSWQNMTDTAKVVLPKKLYFLDSSGNKVNWDGKAIIGNNSETPILMRGDKISIRLGYVYNTDTEGEVEQSHTYFEGYITKITNKIPIVIECEDRMWQLKQIKVPNKVYSHKDYSVQKMIREMLDAQSETKDITLITGSNVGMKIETNLGDEFRTQDDTIGSVLHRLQKEARLYSYFRNVENADGTFRSELRCSGIVYYPSDRVSNTFGFQQNIISDELEWNRKDDLKLGAKCYSINKEELSTTNANGKKKTTRKRMEVFVGEKEGDIRTLHFWNIKSESELKELGERELRKFYYTGFFGSFTTFGLPKVKHGDQVTLKDKVLPERNGDYLVKSVTTTFGRSGFRQDIALHLKLGPFTDKEIANGEAITTEQLNNGL